MFDTIQAREDFDFEMTRDRTEGDVHRRWHTERSMGLHGTASCPWDCYEDDMGAAYHEAGTLSYTDTSGNHQWVTFYTDQDPKIEARKLAAEVGKAVTISFG